MSSANGCLSTYTDPEIQKKKYYAIQENLFFANQEPSVDQRLVHQHTNSEDDKGEEIQSQVSAEINAIENMLLTALLGGMSPTFEYLRTHRFVNKDSYLKFVAA